MVSFVDVHNDTNMGNCIIGDASYRFWSIYLCGYERVSKSIYILPSKLMMMVMMMMVDFDIYIIMVGWLWTNLSCVNMKMFRAFKALVNYPCKEWQDIDHIFTIIFLKDKWLKTIDVTCQNIL